MIIFFIFFFFYFPGNKIFRLGKGDMLKIFFLPDLIINPDKYYDRRVDSAQLMNRIDNLLTNKKLKYFKIAKTNHYRYPNEWVYEIPNKNLTISIFYIMIAYSRNLMFIIETKDNEIKKIHTDIMKMIDQEFGN